MNREDPFEYFINEINNAAVKYGWNVACHEFGEECESLTVTFVPAIGSDSQNRKF